ncbi:kinase-like domain-containing protein [Hyaloraphidium curvatum]|nr:kinase-like domain-containing protein [Hyaloraphidium curvatum]
MLRRDAHPPLDWSVGADRQNQRRRSDNCGIPLHRGGASGNSAGRVVLVDFGSATTCPVDTRECGTYAYLGPEILDSSGPYDPQRADVFALGTILHLMAFGTHPFPNDPSCTTAQRVQQMRAGPEFPASIYVSAELKDLICQCLRPDPAARPTVAQALEHPWIRNDKFHVAGLSWRRLSGSFKLGSFAELPQPPAFSAAGQGMTPLSGAPQGGVPGLRRFSGSRGTDKAAVALAEARRWTEAVRRVECDRGMDPAGKAAALRRLLAERLDRPRH